MRRLLVLLAVLAAVAPATANGTVVNHRVDAGHTGEIPNAKLTAPVGRKWFRPDIKSASAPLIADGRVFVAADRVVALERETGRTIWTGGGQSVGFAYADGVLFSATATEKLEAIDAATGAIRWSVPLDGHAGIPTYDDGTVYLGVEDRIQAFRASDGFELWSSSAWGASEGALGVDAERVYAVSGCAETTAVERRLGLTMWRYVGGCTGGGGATPMVADGRVYAPNRGEGAVLEASSGKLVRRDLAGDPARAGDRVINDGGTLIAQDRDGRVLWSAKRPDGGSRPIVLGGVAWATEGEALAGYDVGTGALVQRVGNVAEADAHTAQPSIASDGEWLVVAGRRVVGLAAGADAAAPDDAKPPPGPPQTTVTLRTSATVFEPRDEPVELTAYFGPGIARDERTVFLQADRFPFDGRWEDAGPMPDGYAKVRPTVNTRYRAVDRTTGPFVTSEPVQVRVDFASRLSLRALSRRTILATATVFAPQGLSLRGRRVFFYQLRRGQRYGTRIRSVRWRASRPAGLFRASIRIPYSSVRRTDTIFFCFRNPLPNAIGKPVRGPDPCGRKRA